MVINEFEFVMQSTNLQRGKEEKYLKNPQERIVPSATGSKKYDALFEYVPMAVVHVTQKGKLIDVNGMAVTLTGYSAEELSSLDFCDLFADKLALCHAAFADSLYPDHYFSTETEIKKKCGTFLPVEIKSNVLEDKSVLHFIQDITDRKSVENSLKEREARLRELNATKDKFFSIIAHDLKSPFNAIVGFSSMMTEQLRKKEYEGLEEYAEIIQNSSHRAMELLRNLLEWSRSQTGTMSFHPEYVDLVTLINETNDLLRDSAKQKSISISKNLPSNLIVMADRPMVNSVLRNLVSNAIKFTHSGGKILITGEQSPDELLICVKDSGIGVSKNDQRKLFRIDESFTKAGTHNEKGTGLGLILCKEFIDKHGGKIWVESEIGCGSTFCFTLPMIMY